MDMLMSWKMNVWPVGEETAYNSYLSLLYGWLNYLKTNVSQFIDYPISENKDILVKNIKKYYD